MIVGGYNHAGVFSHAASTPGTVPTRADAPVTAAEETRQTDPTYFRSISSISYGSLAGAYQTIRAFESGATSAASGAADKPVILSGAGIPAALSAYDEAMES